MSRDLTVTIMSRVATFSLAIQSSGMGFRAVMVIPVRSRMKRKTAARRLELRHEYVKPAAQRLRQAALALLVGVFEVAPARAACDLKQVPVVINQIIPNRVFITHSGECVL